MKLIGVNAYVDYSSSEFLIFEENGKYYFQQKKDSDIDELLETISDINPIMFQLMGTHCKEVEPKYCTICRQEFNGNDPKCDLLCIPKEQRQDTIDREINSFLNNGIGIKNYQYTSNGDINKQIQYVELSPEQKDMLVLIPLSVVYGKTINLKDLIDDIIDDEYLTCYFDENILLNNNCQIFSIKFNQNLFIGSATYLLEKLSEGKFGSITKDNVKKICTLYSSVGNYDEAINIAKEVMKKYNHELVDLVLKPYVKEYENLKYIIQKKEELESKCLVKY